MRATLALLLLSACAANEYLCPEPVGQILRDDCEAYQHLGDATAPSRKVAQRLVAVCQDFNACRYSAADYTKRRDQLRRTIEEAAALSRLLEPSDLTHQERQLLTERLDAMLAEVGAAPLTTDDESEDQSTSLQGEPWFGSRYQPPVAPPVERDVPRLVWPWGEVSLHNVMERVDKEYVNREGQIHRRRHEVVGYSPQLTTYLWGRAVRGDELDLRFENSMTVRCPVGLAVDGIFAVSCSPPDELALGASHFDVEIRYRQAINDVPVRIGTIRYFVSRFDERQPAGEPIHTYYLDWDHRLEQGWLYFRPEPGPGSPAFEQPHLRVTVRLGQYAPEMTARCTVGGAPVTEPIASGLGSDQTGWMQHRPGDHLYWWHFDFALPFAIPRGHVDVPVDLHPWPPRAGDWRCEVSADGVPLRVLRFTVAKDGWIVPVDFQDGKDGHLVHPWWRVETEALDNEVEPPRAFPAPR